MQTVEQHPRLGIALRTHDADAQTNAALANGKSPPVAARCDVVAEPEHRLVLVVAGRIELLLHADRTALVRGPQTRFATQETGVSACVHDDARREFLRAGARITRAHSREPLPLALRALDMRLQPNLGTGVLGAGPQPLVGPA